MNITAKQSSYRGDIGRFRKALNKSGFPELARCRWSFFNDDSKDHTRRRLKCLNAHQIFNSGQKVQRILESELRKEFDDRIITMYFIKRPEGSWLPNQMSLCIKLRD